MKRKAQDEVEVEIKRVGVVVSPQHGPEGLVVEVGLRTPTGETPRAAGKITFTGYGPGKWKGRRGGNGGNTPAA